MNRSGPLRVAALVDLPRTPQSGGQVKCWERLAAAAAAGDLPLDLTVYFSGRAPVETLGPGARFCHLPPVFSTASLKFLPYAPDHTDLAPYHPGLARELSRFDVIHTTDGFFAFARTAQRVSRARGIPLVNSFHTDTPAYTRIFTRQTIEKICGTAGFGGWLARVMIENWKLPEHQGRAMERKLRRHLADCRYALVTRAEDHALAESVLGPAAVRHLRLGVDKTMFGPHRRDREGIERDYRILRGSTVVLFVGRVDIGKNIHTLIGAMEKLLAQEYPVHLVVAGTGPAVEDVKKRLGGHASTPGFVAPDELARLYASVDALALSSEVEIRSMAGVEAMTSGCPVLVSRLSGIAQLFDHTQAMQTVESGVDAWEAALADFASHPGKQNAMRAIAAEYGRDRLAGWKDVLAEDLLAVWQQAAGWSAQQRAAA